MMDRKPRILILCTGNSARSQMAEAYLRSAAGDRFEVHSAGVAPSTVRDEAVAVLKEIGVPAVGLRSKSMDEFIGQDFDHVITVCDNAAENCPVFPADTERIHWSFEDPATIEGTDEERLEAFRRVRDQIIERLDAWLAKS